MNYKSGLNGGERGENEIIDTHRFPQYIHTAGNCFL